MRPETKLDVIFFGIIFAILFSIKWFDDPNERCVKEHNKSRDPVTICEK